MKTTTLQTRNIDIKVKEKAEKQAMKLGFNTVQDVVRVFLKDFSEGLIIPETAWKYSNILSKASSVQESDDEVMEEVIGQIKDYRKTGNV